MKTEHGVPIPRRAAVPRIAGYAAGGVAWLALIFEPMPHRYLVVTVAAGLAAVLSATAYRLMAETHQQTRVLRAALGYRRGERPWTWSEHFAHGMVPVAVGLSMSSTLDGDGADARILVIGGIIFSWAAAVGVSAVQKRRHERSDRKRFGSPDVYRSAQRFG